MQTSETAKLLSKAALIDNRHIDREVVTAWHEIIGHLRYDDALAALTIHRKESTDYLQPNHIIINARKARDARELEENRKRALCAAPSEKRSTPPKWFREFLDGLGKEKDGAA